MAKAGGGRGGAGGGGGGGGGEDVEVSQSVKYVLDLFIAAYFQFDTTVRDVFMRTREWGRRSVV